MPFEIFIVPGIICLIFAFVKGYKYYDQIAEEEESNNH